LDHFRKCRGRLGVGPFDLLAAQRVLAPAQIQVGVLDQVEVRVVLDDGGKGRRGLVELFQLLIADAQIVLRFGGQGILGKFL
jgi:hypothetical protein